MTTIPMYSLRTDPSGYRITKFVDGEVESSYLCSESECECPAGHRHTCRHRQMLPTMLAHGIANTHWFYLHDRGGQIVDFNGTDKRLLDQLARVQEPETAGAPELKAVGEIINPKVDGIPHLGGVYAKDITPVGEAQHSEGKLEPQTRPWRRL